MRILLIEDNSALAKLINNHLSKLHIVDQADNAQTARFFLDTKNYDLLITNADFVDDENYQLDHYSHLSTLLLTTELTIEQKIICLQRGMDYLIKPFHILELMSKVKFLFQKTHQNWKKFTNINLTLDQFTRQVFVNDKEIQLNRKEYALLELFLSNSKQIFSKATLAEKIWQEDQVLMGNTIATTISHLRKKIGKNFIKTIKGVGYTIR